MHDAPYRNCLDGAHILNSVAKTWQRLSKPRGSQGARGSVSDLADLGLSHATVRARMERLERSGDIIGYTLALRADAGRSAHAPYHAH